MKDKERLVLSVRNVIKMSTVEIAPNEGHTKLTPEMDVMSYFRQWRCPFISGSTQHRNLVSNSGDILTYKGPNKIGTVDGRSV